MKRILCFIMILLLLTPAAFAAEDKMTFRVESASGKVGDTVTVTGLVENAPVCASFRVILTYDNTVLEPVSAAKLECGGLFMSNVKYTYQGKAAVNVLSADANKSLEGNMKLFSVTFKIIAESPESNGSPLTVAHQEFFDPSTPKPQQVHPVVEPGRIFVGDDKPGEDNNAGGDTTPDGGTTPDNDTPVDGTTPDNDTPVDGTTPDNDTPVDGTTPDTDKSEAKRS